MSKIQIFILLKSYLILSSMLLQLFVSKVKDINLNVNDKINYNVPRCADKLGSFSQTNSLNTACNVIY